VTLHAGLVIDPRPTRDHGRLSEVEVGGGFEGELEVVGGATLVVREDE